ncbi:MAG: hypothetical protein PHQ23_13575 [Candidatus Wallbacteria bacterium]|nr:hypothetical protein [Candidatus Wallbacteria bacterium]
MQTVDVQSALVTEVLRVSITPIVDDMEPGSSEVFTARIIYADADETPAHIPQPSSDDWKWECTGTEGGGGGGGVEGDASRQLGGWRGTRLDNW